MDCATIGRLLDLADVNEKGFVVIQTTPTKPLDVGAVYTADGG